MQVEVSKRTPKIRVSGSSTAPVANTVLADTGALPAGDYDIEVTGCVMDIAGVGLGLLVQHRDAGNANNVFQFGGCGSPGSFSYIIRRLTLADNERVRIITGTANATAGGRYVLSVAAFPLAPTP